MTIDGLTNLMDLAIIRASLAAASVDPLKIATNAEKDGKVSLPREEGGIFQILELSNLYQLLKREVFLWGAIVTVFLLMTMLFVSKSEKLAEKKADVLHKLFVVFLASSTLFLLSALVNLLDAIF